MNKIEVLTAIELAGRTFGNVMAASCGDEFGAGYRKAIGDMKNLISNSTMDADFEAERKAMRAEIKELKAKNAELEREVHEKHETIQKLLPHVNIAEVVGVRINEREKRKKSRGFFFIFK